MELHFLIQQINSHGTLSAKMLCGSHQVTIQDKTAGTQLPLEGDPILFVGLDQLQNNIHQLK